MKSFNALLRASFFSTFVLPDETEYDDWVSMPYFGLLSFLQLLMQVYYQTDYMFQCPTSGFFLFYAMSLHSLILLAFQPPFCK